MIEEKHNKKWIFILIVFLIVFSLFAGVAYFKKEKLNADFIIVKKSDLIQEVSATGSIKPENEVDLSFEKNGKVSSVNIDIGDKVYSGQILMRLNSDDLKANLLRTSANLAEEEAKLSKLKAGTRIEEINVQKVKVENAGIVLSGAKKDVLNKLRNAYSKSDDAIRNKVDQLFINPRSTNPKLGVVISNNQLEISVESGRLEMEQILTSWENDLNLLTIDSDLLSFVTISDNNLSQVRNFLDSMAFVVNTLTESASISQTTIDGYRASVWTARSNTNTAIVNVATAQEKLHTAQSALTLSQNELTLKEASATEEEIALQRARVLSSDASVQDVLANIAKTIIYSPISGIVTKVDVKVGEIISANTPLISVISDNNFEIEADIAEADIAKIKIDDTARVTLDAYGDDIVFEAVVVSIDPSETVIEGVPTYKTKFKILSSENNIKSGMTANINILTNKKTNIITVPARVVKVIDGTKIVRVLNDDGSIEERSVETGLRGSSGRIEILKGIKEGEKVIIFIP